MITIPSGLFQVASAGHTGTQGGSSQCIQGLGSVVCPTFGYVPISSWITGLYITPGGSLFSAAHETEHASHPTHFLRSMTIFQFLCSIGFLSAL